jgi:hypothetical protein
VASSSPRWAQPEQLNEQVFQIMAVPPDEPSGRGVVDAVVARNDPAPHIVPAGGLDLA